MLPLSLINSVSLKGQLHLCCSLWLKYLPFPHVLLLENSIYSSFRPLFLFICLFGIFCFLISLKSGAGISVLTKASSSPIKLRSQNGQVLPPMPFEQCRDCSSPLETCPTPTQTFTNGEAWALCRCIALTLSGLLV